MYMCTYVGEKEEWPELVEVSANVAVEMCTQWCDSEAVQPPRTTSATGFGSFLGRSSRRCHCCPSNRLITP